MKAEIRCINLRFDIQKEDHRRAWNYLHDMDRREFKSYSNVVVQAVLDYFDRYYKREEDPYFETRERENRFVEQIVAAVRETLEQSLTLYLAGFTASRGVQLQEELRPEPADTDVEPDWAFLGE